MDLKRALLSESIHGAPFNITETGSPGDLIHAAPDGVKSVDEVVLFINNNTNAATEVATLEFTNASQDVVISVPNEDIVTLRFCINAGEELRIYATTADELEVWGWVNRIGVE